MKILYYKAMFTTVERTPKNLVKLFFVCIAINVVDVFKIISRLVVLPLICVIIFVVALIDFSVGITVLAYENIIDSVAELRYADRSLIKRHESIQSNLIYTVTDRETANDYVCNRIEEMRNMRKLNNEL